MICAVPVSVITSLARTFLVTHKIVFMPAVFASNLARVKGAFRFHCSTSIRLPRPYNVQMSLASWRGLNVTDGGVIECAL